MPVETSSPFCRTVRGTSHLYGNQLGMHGHSRAPERGMDLRGIGSVLKVTCPIISEGPENRDGPAATKADRIP